MLSGGFPLPLRMLCECVFYAFLCVLHILFELEWLVGWASYRPACRLSFFLFFLDSQTCVCMFIHENFRTKSTNKHDPQLYGCGKWECVRFSVTHTHTQKNNETVHNLKKKTKKTEFTVRNVTDGGFVSLSNKVIKEITLFVAGKCWIGEQLRGKCGWHGVMFQRNIRWGCGRLGYTHAHSHTHKSTASRKWWFFTQKKRTFYTENEFI